MTSAPLSSSSSSNSSNPQPFSALEINATTSKIPPTTAISTSDSSLPYLTNDSNLPNPRASNAHGKSFLPPPQDQTVLPQSTKPVLPSVAPPALSRPSATNLINKAYNNTYHFQAQPVPKQTPFETTTTSNTANIHTSAATTSSSTTKSIVVAKPMSPWTPGAAAPTPASSSIYTATTTTATTTNGSANAGKNGSAHPNTANKPPKSDRVQPRATKAKSAIEGTGPDRKRKYKRKRPTLPQGPSSMIWSIIEVKRDALANSNNNSSNKDPFCRGCYYNVIRGLNAANEDEWGLRKGWKRRRRRGRRSKAELLQDEEGGELLWHSKVTDVVYDSRFLQPDDRSPFGVLDQLLPRWDYASKQEEDFTTPTKPAATSNDHKFRPSYSYFKALPHLVSIPDPPKPKTKTSRIGAQFQARVARSVKDFFDKTGNADLPGHEVLWDPLAAQEAEARGEDVAGFLSNDLPLTELEFRMRLLRSLDYRVAHAQQEYHRIRDFAGIAEETTLTRSEGVTLERLLTKSSGPTGKDFGHIAAQLKKSKNACLIHYYNWKGRSPAVYREMKRKWRVSKLEEGEQHNDYCTTCQDGGGVMVLCDQCDDAYHLQCLVPKLDAIPTGNWYCPDCSKPARKRGRPPKTTTKPTPRRLPASPTWSLSSPSRHSTPIITARKAPVKASATKPRVIFPQARDEAATATASPKHTQAPPEREDAQKTAAKALPSMMAGQRAASTTASAISNSNGVPNPVKSPATKPRVIFPQAQDETTTASTKHTQAPPEQPKALPVQTLGQQAASTIVSALSNGAANPSSLIIISTPLSTSSDSCSSDSEDLGEVDI